MALMPSTGVVAKNHAQTDLANSLPEGSLFVSLYKRPARIR